MSEIKVYMAKFYKDRGLQNNYAMPEWIIPIQVGAALTGERAAVVLDCDGENISIKNVNYCELTALYWVWKNCCNKSIIQSENYYGLFHYRRILDINEEDIKRVRENDIDVILPFPTIHEPNIWEHHSRYIKESDWEAMLQALEELAPDYYKSVDKVFSQQYLYNYNMLIAKEKIFLNYCKWLFPILKRTEEISVPKGSEREDRYIGYLGENLLTLYFMHHGKDLRIAHTGRIMLT